MYVVALPNPGARRKLKIAVCPDYRVATRSAWKQVIILPRCCKPSPDCMRGFVRQPDKHAASVPRTGLADEEPRSSSGFIATHHTTLFV